MDTRELSVTLPSDTLYVSGTVNEVSTVWTNTEGNTWQSTVDRSEDDIYRISLTIINQAGTTSYSNLTIYYGLNLITDRTQADLLKAQTLSKKRYEDMTDSEREEWDSDLKGSYNTSDMNRVAGAINYLKARLVPMGYGIRASPKNDWLDTDIPTPEQITEYHDNIEEIRSQFEQYATTPATPDINALTIEGANDIEKILLITDDTANRIEISQFYSAEIYTGEV